MDNFTEDAINQLQAKVDDLNRSIRKTKSVQQGAYWRGQVLAFKEAIRVIEAASKTS